MLSFVVVLLTGFLLLAALVVSTVLAWVLKSVDVAAVADRTTAWRLVDQAISFALIAVLLAILYKVLPDVKKIFWHDVWLGAATAAVLLTIGKYLLALYLDKSGTASVFGAAAAPIVILIWVYYSAQIVLFGAELVRAHATTHGSDIVPTENAEFVVPIAGRQSSAHQ
jgi:membrane protein